MAWSNCHMHISGHVFVSRIPGQCTSGTGPVLMLLQFRQTPKGSTYPSPNDMICCLLAGVAAPVQLMCGMKEEQQWMPVSVPLASTVQISMLVAMSLLNAGDSMN